MTHVTVVEVGPRDGLQNEQQAVSPETKIELVRRLADCGLAHIEVTSFVSPKAIPQLADASQVATAIVADPAPGVTYSALVPNLTGYERAREAGIRSIALFTAASETFNQRNIKASIDESLERSAPVVSAARTDGVSVRAYISCAFGCPYEGDVAPAAVHRVAEQLLELGVDTLSVGDTIGVAVPAQIAPVCKPLLEMTDAPRVALHLHDTRGTALSNVWAGLELGLATFDSSAAGLGGCPFAPGATGNLATEDLVWFLERNGCTTGVDLPRLIQTSRWISEQLNREPYGHIAHVRMWP